ncbi:hypothetical protein HDU96_007888 [Phlyctochytrium bullatum]|nr:hypothetical protein HDU96_007888 [Phlyctochytrium bullatum]
MSSAQKKKFNKTKRGGPRKFTTEDVWDVPRDKEEDSDSEAESDAQERPAPSNRNAKKKAIGRSEDTSSDDEDSEPDVLPKPKDYGKPPPEPEPVEQFERVNMNRAPVKNLKASDLNSSDSAPMSRRER